MDDNGTEKLLTLEEVRNKLGLHANTLYRYINNGMLPVVVITRNKRFIRQSDLEKFLREHTGVYKQ